MEELDSQIALVLRQRLQSGSDLIAGWKLHEGCTLDEDIRNETMPNGPMLCSGGGHMIKQKKNYLVLLECVQLQARRMENENGMVLEFHIVDDQPTKV